ncbi:hypothetical protein Tco_0729307 [Tanacetum coccineum]|uniref:Integrase, catalytic region, zinc finger, CCHC-type, peptidase aspartic, catalytic n=1 Tax=Tanacetum coccineum TaxID=301880 RepID=A0ABQ4YQW9_9ASTR
MSFVKPEFLKKAQRVNPRLYDIGCYNDNLALILAPESDETILLSQESRSKLSDLIKSFDYKNLNNLYDLFVPQREKSPEQRYFSERLDEVTNLECDYLEALEKCEGVISTTSVSRPQLKSKQLEDRVMHNNSQGKKQQVEDHSRNFKFSNNKTSVTACNESLNAKTSNVNFVCVTCGKYVLNENHDMCVLHYINDVNSRTKQPIDVPITHDGKSKLLSNFVEKFMGTVKFKNDQITPILGYGDLVQGNVTIKMVYYVEGLNHNLFSIGRFCDADLEVAFRKSTYYIRDLKGNDLLTDERKGDAWIVIWYSTQSRAYRVHNKRTRVIVETIHVNFDELPPMASDHVSSDPVPKSETVITSNVLDLLFSPMFDELLNGTTTTVDALAGSTTGSADDGFVPPSSLFSLSSS